MKLSKLFESIGLLEATEGENSSQSQVSEGVAKSANTTATIENSAAAGLGAESLSAVQSEDPPIVAGDVDDARTLDDIYQDAKIPPSPFSANKLLKLLEGLSTLPEETRKQAVNAMDAAEDGWTIEDPLLDAQRCVQALEDEGQRLAQMAKQAESYAKTELKAQEDYEQQATAQIRQQIRELEDLLEQEMKSIAEKRESIKTTAKVAQQTCQRQQTRLQKEISRLQQISAMFTMATGATTNQSNNPSGTTHG